MMPTKIGRLHEAGIRLAIEKIDGESIESYRDRLHGAINSVFVDAKERLIDVEIVTSMAFRDGRSSVFDCYGIAKQSSDGGMRAVPSFRRNFWDHALFATDAQWFRDRGFIVTQNSGEYFCCSKCGMKVDGDSEACFQCGEFDDVVFNGQDDGVPLEEGRKWAMNKSLR